MKISPRGSVMNSGNALRASWAFSLKWIFRAVTLTITSQSSDVQHESRAVARKPHNAAAVLFGLKFADNIHYKLKSN